VSEDELETFRPSGLMLFAAAICFVFGLSGQIATFFLTFWYGHYRTFMIIGFALLASELLGLYLFLEWNNRRVFVSPDGIETTGLLGRSSGWIAWSSVLQAQFEGFGTSAVFVIRHDKGQITLPENVRGYDRLIDYVRRHCPAASTA
jgi:hypothetical protein